MAIHGSRLFPIGLIAVSTALAGAQAKPAGAADSAAPAPPVPAAITAPAPEIPKRPAELPPKPPKVTCRGDQLSISADNSTLDAILAAVRGCTGAKIDVPNGAAAVRSFEELGPGPVREVLDQLLSGTQYNYVILSSAANPLKVESVLLSMRSTDKDSPNTLPTDLPSTPGRRAWAHMQKFDKPDPSNPDTPMDDTESPASENAAAPTSADPNAASARAGDAAPVEAAAPPTPPVPPAAAPVADPVSNSDPSKGIEDRIAAMQQLFNQRQQMIQKQNQGQPASPNN